jgi:hypothetical protein
MKVEFPVNAPKGHQSQCRHIPDNFHAVDPPAKDIGKSRTRIWAGTRVHDVTAPHWNPRALPLHTANLPFELGGLYGDSAAEEALAWGSRATFCVACG